MPDVFASAATCQPDRYKAFNPAFACWTAWLPVSTPKVLTKSSWLRYFHNFSSPLRAKEYSIFIVPWSFLTSLTEYSLFREFHLLSISLLGVLLFPLAISEVEIINNFKNIISWNYFLLTHFYFIILFFILKKTK